ncbi:hypothetical protein [Maribacter sp. 2307ULW6-5]|uniref:hypothetical protein n=1 Tax=Maribacter sp. 2307ULW6-5 TaxID=3386275 RepID=UPI0039BD4A61
MGHIKEPKGVDFLIESKPLTDKEREKISEFIKKRKELAGQKTSTKKKQSRTRKPAQK